MLPKPVRRLVSILLLIAFGYYAYNMVRVHTSHEVIAFKQFSSALMENDRMAAKKLVVGDRQLEPFSKRAKRDEALRGDVRWTYYKIRNFRRSEDGKTSTLRVRQIIRLDPPGMDSFFGTEKIINIQDVVLVSPKSAWKIEQYRDNFYFPGMKQK